MTARKEELKLINTRSKSTLLLCPMVPLLFLCGAQSTASFHCPIPTPHALESIRSKNCRTNLSKVILFENIGESIHRREFLQASSKILGAAAYFSTIPSSSALAPQIASNTLCDPSVSTWTKTYSSGVSSPTRTIHILGTAHISSSSASLAGSMVRELKPTVVFVELDAKRVARAIPRGISSNATPDESKTEVKTTNISAGSKERSGPSTMDTGLASTPALDNPSSLKKSNPFDMQSKLLNVGSKYVGDAVKGMYSKLESEGFKAGDEFAVSVREGLAIGSTIVLGDRDVELTLRRLTQALARTDIRKLLSSDSAVEQSMEELLSDNMKIKLKQSSSGSLSLENVDIDKEEFQSFVETMKAKDNVKKIMRALQTTAPEIYEAMVAERDLYMGRGLDELGSNLNNDARRTVAVMGMAHVDGVERYLASHDWKRLNYPCAALRSN